MLLGYEKLTRLNFMPQHLIEDLILRSLVISSENDSFKLDETQLLQFLEKEFDECQGTLRRRLPQKSNLTVIRLVPDSRKISQKSELLMGFPCVRFSSENGNQNIGRPVSAKELMQVVFEGNSETWQESIALNLDKMCLNPEKYSVE